MLGFSIFQQVSKIYLIVKYFMNSENFLEMANPKRIYIDDNDYRVSKVLRQLWPKLFEFFNLSIFQIPIFIQLFFANSEDIDRLDQAMKISDKITKKMCEMNNLTYFWKICCKFVVWFLCYKPIV